MDYLILLLLFSFVCASIHFFISSIHSSKSSQLPPGPHPFPIIGNIFDLGSQTHQALTDLSKIYGPLMTLKLGSITTIVVSSPEAAKEVLHKHDQACSSRPIPDTVRALDHHKLTLGWLPTSVTQWRVQRRACATKIFSAQQLDSTQVLRQRKVKNLLDYVQEYSRKGEALDIGEAAFTTVLNSMSNTFFSIDLAHYNSDASQEFKDIIMGVVDEIGRPNASDLFPFCRFFDPQGARARMKNRYKKLLRFLDGIVEERLRLRASKRNSGEFSDVLDCFLDLMEESSELSRSNVLHLFMDLFVAGIDTTSITVEWAMAELLHNPEKMVKAKEEIQRVLGKDGQFEESHLSKFPFLRAVVKETLRLHPPAPFLVPHKSIDDIEIFGFMVPKNAQILVNVWAMGRESSIWNNPNLFEPERFLDSNIDFKGGNFEFIPFGAGRRICPGLPLASRAVQFMLTSLLHNYDWELAEGMKPEDMDMSERYGLTLHRIQPLRAIPIVKM